MNKKEKKFLNLTMLTKRVERHIIDRRTFMKGAVALGLTASSAMLLYQAYDGGLGGTGTVFAQEGKIKRLLPELYELPNDLRQGGLPTPDKSAIFVAIFLAHPFVVHSSQVFERELTDPWVGMDYTVVDSAFDSVKEQEHLDLAISRNFDVIMGFPVDPAGIGSQIRRARDAGQIFVNWATDSIVRPTLKYGFMFYVDGYLAGKYAASVLPAGSKVYGGVGDYVVSAGFMRRQGWLDAIAESGLESVAFEEGTAWTQEGGYNMGRTVLQRFPDIQAIFGGDDQGALGFQKAAVDAGRREELIVIGVDGLREGQEGVADGRLDASIMFYWGHGPEAVGAIDQTLVLLRGGVHGDSVEMAHIFEMITVTKDNIAEQWMSPT
jgi:ABC-type sugar transport system substrate-binding protein